MAKKYTNVIIGAGITGLSAAFYLGADYLLIESGKRCGGAFNSVVKKGYHLDLGERFIRIDSGKEKYFREIFGRGFFVKSRLYSQICVKDKRYRYPFQYNLYGMDKKNLDLCIAEARKSLAKKKKPANFREWILLNYGKGIAGIFMMPYNRKIWCVDPSEMAYDWFYNDKVVPKGDIKKIIEGSMKSFGQRGGVKSLGTRYYPRKGGAAAVPEFMEKRLKRKVLYGAKAVKIDADKKEVVTSNGDRIRYENLISTIPLTELVRIIKPGQKDLKKLAKGLKYNSVLCVWVAVKKKVAERYHWLYFPESKYPFSRLYFQHNFSEDTVPRGKSAIGAIFTYIGKAPRIGDVKKQLVGKLMEMGMLETKKDIDYIDHVNMKYGFCIPTLGAAAVSKKIRGVLREKDIYSIGRYGEWKYSGLEQALEDGRSIAHSLRRG